MLFDLILSRPVLRFVQDRSGNIAMMTALLMFPIIGIGGLAIDHMQADSAKVRLDTAADAAALAAVNTAKAVGTGNSAWGTGDPIEAGRAAALRVFRANANNSAPGSPEPQITLTRVDAEYIASVSWATSSPATFGRLFGKESHPVSGRAEARSGTPLYHEFHIVMDLSASMLIGATAPDIRRTFDLLGCAFACHLQGDSLSYVRSQGGVRMRIDVMKDAIIMAVEELRRRAVMPNQYRFAVYGFASNQRVFLDIADPRSSDYDAVIAAVRAADVWRSNGGGTDVPGVLSWMEPKLKADGDGTAARPIQRMIMISDGMQGEREFSADGNTHGHRTIPFAGSFRWIGDSRTGLMDPRLCDPIKSKGVEIATVHVEYVIITDVPGVTADWLINDMAYMKDTLIPQMSTTMGGCASSPLLYADASTPAEINRAIQGAFTNLRRPTITN